MVIKPQLLTSTLNDRSHHRVGHVFQGHYGAIIIENNNYLLELIRYVVHNPVRAGMVNNPADWHWICYGAVVGTTTQPAWQQTDLLLAHFGRSRGEAIASFCGFRSCRC